ncbi:MAG: hypothetical protein R6W73_01155, partial [Candidatus Saliniplasma sp.]
SSDIRSTVTVLEVTTVDLTSATQVGEVGGNRQKGRRSPLTGRSCKFSSVVRKPDDIFGIKFQIV